MNDAGPPHATHARRWRIAGLAMLLLGGLAAGATWWLQTRTPSLMDDPAMQNFNRAEHRQMGQLFGKSGYLVDDLLESLKQPGTQAILIAAVAVVLAVGCFWIARLPAPDPAHDIFKPSKPEPDGKR